MSKLNKLNNRLNDLFTEMSSEKVASPKSYDMLTGWNWQCDASGYYLACSLEVTKILGIDPSIFIGELLSDFKLSSQSSKDLTAAMHQSNKESLEINLYYLDQENSYIPVRAYIFRQESDSGEIIGWSGFCQLLQLENIIDEDYQNEERNTTISSLSNPENNPILVLPDELTKEENRQPEEIYQIDLNQASYLDKLLLLEKITEKLKSIMENAQLDVETQHSLNQNDALYVFSQFANTFETIKALIQSIIDTITAVLPSSRTLAVIFDLSKEKVIYYLVSNAPPIKINNKTYDELLNGLIGKCLIDREPILIHKVEYDLLDRNDLLSTKGTPKDGSVIVVPIIYQDWAFGSLITVNNVEQPNFTQKDVDLLSAIATKIAETFGSAKRFQLELNNKKIVTAFHNISREIGSSLDLPIIYECLLSKLAEIFEYNTISLQIIEGDKYKQIGIIQNDSKPEINVQHDLPKPISDDAILNSVLENQQPLLITDTHLEIIRERFPEFKQVRSLVALPLLQADTVIGLIVLKHIIPDIYTEDSLELLTAIATQASLTISNAKQYQKSVFLQKTTEILGAISGIKNQNAIMKQVVNLIREHFHFNFVGIFLIDKEHNITYESGKWAILRASAGDFDGGQVDSNKKCEIGDKSIVGTCISTGKFQISDHTVTEDHRFKDPSPSETQSKIALPLVNGDSVIGAILFTTNIQTTFLIDDISILQFLADNVANKLHNAILFDQFQIRANELAVLNEMSCQVFTKYDIDSISKNIHQFTSRLIDTSTFFIAIYNKTTDLVYFPFITENNQPISIPTQTNNQGLTKYVIDSRQPLLINSNVEQWSKDQGVDFITLGPGKVQVSQTWMGAPMIYGNDVVGLINIQHKDPYRYNDHDLELLLAIANQAAIALKNAQYLKDARQQLRDFETIISVIQTLSIQPFEKTNISEKIALTFIELLDNATTISVYLQEPDNPNEMKTSISLSKSNGKIAVDENSFQQNINLSEYPETARVMQSLRPLITQTKHTIPGFKKLGFMETTSDKNLVIYPLVVNNKSIGVIELKYHNNTQNISDGKLKSGLVLANQAAIALENARLSAELHETTNQLS